MWQFSIKGMNWDKFEIVNFFLIIINYYLENCKIK